MATRLPPTKDVRDVLEGILGREVDVATGIPMPVPECAALGVYRTDAGRLSAAVAVDLPLAAYIGTSVALVPAAGAAAMIEDRYLPESALENVAEVLNVLASVVNQHSDEHHRLVGTHRGQVDGPTDALQLLTIPGNRLDLDVSVHRYGQGRMSYVLTG